MIKLLYFVDEYLYGLATHEDNEAAIENNENYTLSKYAMNSSVSMEWNTAITMQYCNSSKTQVLVG